MEHTLPATTVAEVASDAPALLCAPLTFQTKAVHLVHLMNGRLRFQDGRIFMGGHTRALNKSLGSSKTCHFNAYFQKESCWGPRSPPNPQISGVSGLRPSVCCLRQQAHSDSGWEGEKSVDREDFPFWKPSGFIISSVVFL